MTRGRGLDLVCSISAISALGAEKRNFTFTFCFKNLLTPNGQSSLLQVDANLSFQILILAIVNTIVPLAFPSIRLDQSEVMNELREIKLLCFHFSTFLFQEKTIRKVPRALIPRSDCSFIPRSPFRVLKIANQSNLLSSQDSVDVSGNEVQILFLSANFLNISVV